MTTLSIGSVPEGIPVPPGALVLDRPSTWYGRPIEWGSNEAVVPVFMERFVLPIGPQETPIYLFGARHDISTALVGGRSFGSGFIVEFFVAMQDSVSESPEWRTHRLLQRASTVFSETPDKDDFVAASKVRSPRERSLANPPVWELKEQAIWPTKFDAPMVFVGQVKLPDNATTQQFLKANATAYLFWASADGGQCFKVFLQEAGIQSLEQHEKDELHGRKPRSKRGK